MSSSGNLKVIIGSCNNRKNLPPSYNDFQLRLMIPFYDLIPKFLGSSDLGIKFSRFLNAQFLLVTIHHQCKQPFHYLPFQNHYIPNEPPIWPLTFHLMHLIETPKSVITSTSENKVIILLRKKKGQMTLALKVSCLFVCNFLKFWDFWKYFVKNFYKP